MKQEFGTPFHKIATGVTAAYATVTGAEGQTIYITDIQMSSDLVTGALWSVLDGSTVIWQGYLGSSADHEDHTFQTPLGITSGNNATVQINATSQAIVCVAGFKNT